MAKKRHRPRTPGPRPAPDEAPSRGKQRREEAKRETSAPVPEPRFFFGFEIAWAKLVVARFALFTLLALDALVRIRHAPRYGAGDFNVAQLPGLDALGPGRLGYGIGQLVCGYLMLLAACGVATRLVLPIATALYAWLYFGSQLDSYQHHYLVVLVLFLACFVPWERPAGATPATPVRSWAVRVILLQLGIMYLWAAISKMDPAWLDGRTLQEQIFGPLRTMIVDTVGFKSAARFALLVELVLAFTVWMRPAWFLALPLGVAFHVGILLSDLEIGMFAWLMLAFYLLVIPDAVWVWLAETPPLRALRAVVRGIRIERAAVAWVIAGLCIGIALALGAVVRFHQAFAVATILAFVPVVLGALGGLRGHRTFVAAAGVAHVLAIVVWLLVDRASSVAFDYYKFWGGNARRLGDPVAAEYAYRRQIAIAPDEPGGHYQLGKLLLGRDDQAGLAELHVAQSLEPLKARAWMAEAEWLRKQGRTAEAIEKAREATYSEPERKEARDLLDALTGTKAAPPAGAGSGAGSGSGSAAGAGAGATDDDDEPATP